MAGGASPSGGHGDGDGGMIEGINITPLVDVVLVLLIIFIVTAKIIVTPSVPLDLPQASETEELQVVFSVILPLSGPTLVNGEPAYSDEELGARAAAALADDPRLRAVIHADGGVPHRRVIAALDAIKRAGVARVAFAAEALDGPGPSASASAGAARPGGGAGPKDGAAGAGGEAGPGASAGAGPGAGAGAGAGPGAAPPAAPPRPAGPGAGPGAEPEAAAAAPPAAPPAVPPAAPPRPAGAGG